MAVNISKPEINIREKLKELDNSSYDRLPIGSVVQVQYNVLPGLGAVNESETNSDSWQPTLFNVSISPRYANSMIVIQSAPNIKSNGSSAYHDLAVFKSIDGEGYSQLLPSYGATASPHGSMNWRFNGESLWYANAPILIVDYPATTGEVNYKIYHRVTTAGAYVVRVGENSADEYMMAMEIKQ